MGKYRSLGTGFDKTFRNDLNANFDEIDKDIKAETTRAKQREDNIQAQVNTLVVNGDSSPAAAQAAVDAKGVDKGNLKQRLDDDYNELSSHLAQKATVKIFNEMPTPSDLLEGELGLIVGRAISPFVSIFNVDASATQVIVQGDFRNLQSTDIIRFVYAKRNVFSGLDNYLSAGMKDEGVDEA